MSLATREQKAVVTNFAGAGRFGPFARRKDMKERLKENTSEQSRLRTTVKYNGERKRELPQLLQVNPRNG